MSSLGCVECKKPVKLGSSNFILCNVCFDKPIHRQCIKPPSNAENATCGNCAGTKVTRDLKNGNQIYAILTNSFELKNELKIARHENRELSAKLEAMNSKLEQLASKMNIIEEARDEVVELDNNNSRKRFRVSGRAPTSRSSSNRSRTPSVPPSYTPATHPPYPAAPPRQQVIKGTLSLSSKIKAVKTLQSYKKVFISRISTEVAPKDIFDHLTDRGISPLKVCKINSRRPDLYSSFCIVAKDNDNFSKCMTPDCWPEDSIIMEFEGNLTDRNMSTAYPPDKPSAAPASFFQRPSHTTTEIPEEVDMDSTFRKES